MRLILYKLLTLTSCLYALIRGGRAERQVAAIILVADTATFAIALVANDNFRSPQWFVFSVDAAMFLALWAVAARSPREWPAWMAACQLLAALAHPARALTPVSLNWIYYILAVGWAYVMPILLVVATWRHRKRLRDPNARLFSPASSMRSFLSGLRRWPQG